MRLRDVATSVVLLLVMAMGVEAQEPEPAVSPSHWMRMSDGVLVGFFNHQGGPRGGDEFKSTNWLMGMASRPAGNGVLQLTGMISLDPATATPRGYREIF